MIGRKFGLIGAAGYVAPRHMSAISSVGGNLVAACDPFDSVGILDRHFPECKFFTEVERFDRHLEKLRRFDDGSDAIDYLSICTPNYLHDAHCRMALRLGADAICEKPLVITPRNIDQLMSLEEEYGKRVYSILQLRLHPEAERLKSLYGADGPRRHVSLKYVTPRGPWYQRSWKGDPEKSGGILMNIGVHFFDLLMWIFGAPSAEPKLIHMNPYSASGELILKGADVSWDLSISKDDVPASHGEYACRSLSIGDDMFDFSSGFTDLHNKSYSRILSGNGFGVSDAHESVSLIHRINKMKPLGRAHAAKFIYR